MNGCHEIQGHLDDWLDGLLEPAEQQRVAAHLQDCAACRRLFERHQAISDGLQALGQLADRMAAPPREADRPARRWQRVGRVAAAVLIVGTIGAGAAWYRLAQRADSLVHAPGGPRQTGTIEGEHVGPSTIPEQREALIHLVKGDDRMVVRLPSKNPRVQIIWLYDQVRPTVENPEGMDVSTRPSS